jgi:hypothetical protein
VRRGKRGRRREVGRARSAEKWCRIDASNETGTSGGGREARYLRGVSDGTRTRDHLDHNQELYQLSYAHRAG